MISNVSVDHVLQHWGKCDPEFLNTLSDRTDVLAYATKLVAKATVLVERDGDEIIGFLAFYLSGDETEVFITNISVIQRQAGTGLGKKLMLALELTLQGQLPSVRRIRLKVGVRNIRARQFYEGAGFSVSGEESPLEIEMVKSVSTGRA